MQTSLNKTFKLQTELGNYCRTGLNAPQTSIQEHTKEYRRLVYNVVEGTLETAFPLTQKLIGQDLWGKSVDYFFQNHKCETPQVWRLPEEFATFYNENELPFDKEFPFIKELLQYEWIEIEVFMMEDLPIEEFRKSDLVENEILVPNPEIKILPLTHPIHKKDVLDINEQDKAQYFVSIHRDFYSKQVKFNDLSYPFVEMIIRVNEEETYPKDLKNIFLKYDENQEKAEAMVNEFIQFALKNNLFLGYKHT